MRTQQLGGRRIRRLLPLAAIAAAAALILSGCSGSSTGDTAASKSLTVAVPTAPVSLDPALQNADTTNIWFIRLMYEPLMNIDDKGDVVAGLADKWEYLDKNASQFQLHLRSGDKFADGTPVTAKDVVASLQYYIKDGVNGATWLGADTKVTAKDDSTVLISTATPNPLLPYLLAHRTNIGSVISAAGLKDTAALKSGSFGAGPYTLDAGATVADNSYVFKKNPNYYRAKQIAYDTITIKVSGSTSAALQALRSGEVDLMRGDYTTAEAAKGTNLKVWDIPLALFGVDYNDREGEIVPALGNVKVRQALSYAIDRKSITKLIWGDLGKPGSAVALDGLDGYDESVSNAYDYDLKKAKALLSEAGYADGFSFNMATPNTQGIDVAGQAIVDSWAKIGVKVKLTTYSDTSQLINDLLAKKYPVSLYLYGSGPQYLQTKSFFNGGANQYNPFNTKDDEIFADLDKAGATSDTDEQNKLYQAVQQRAVVDQAWLSNISYTPSVLIYNNKVADLPVISPRAGVINLADVKPAD